MYASPCLALVLLITVTYDDTFDALTHRFIFIHFYLIFNIFILLNITFKIS